MPAEIPTGHSELEIKRHGLLVEILPQEMPHIHDIRWHAFLCRSILRLGPKGDYLYDPHHQLHPDQVTKAQTTSLKHALEHPYSNSSAQALAKLFPHTDLTLLSGVIRRLDNSPNAKKNLSLCLKSSDPIRLQTLFSYLESACHFPEFDPQKPDCLILAHMKSASPIQATLDETGKTVNGKPLRHILSKASELISGQFAPTVGTALVMSELANTDRFGPMRLYDYHEIDRLIAHYSDHPPKYAFLTGILSFDLLTITEICQKLRNIGIIPVCGGLGPTIDKNGFIRATGAVTFEGEIENAGSKLMARLDQIDPNQPLAITRTELGLPQRVDYQNYYSPESQRSGRLTNYLYHRHLMEQNLTFKGKSFDPSWIFMESLLYNHSCSAGCDFCSTVHAIGTEPRLKPPQTLAMELAATESPWAFIVDQNFTAYYPKRETPDQYTSRINEIFSLIDQRGLRTFYQTEARFFTWLADQSPDLIDKVKRSTVCVLMGLEQPGKVRGSTTKDEKTSEDAIRITNDLGIVSIGTAVVGLNPELTLQDWIDFIDNTTPTVLGPFAKMDIPGSPAVAPSDPDDPQYLDRYKQKFDPRDQELADQISAHYYKLFRIAKRLIPFIHRKPSRLIIATALNSALWGIYATGHTFKETMKNAR